MNSNKGTLYIIAAASGTGKTSLAQALVAAITNIKISISHTTRPKRNGEIDTHNYFFVDPTTFTALQQQNLFLESAKVFNHYYGTSRHWVAEQLSQGIDVVLDIDWQGASQVKNQMECVTIFLLPPSLKELRFRLERRKREDAQTIAKRLAAASSEINHCKEFDYIVINDKFEEALADIKSIVCSHRLRGKHQLNKYAILINELINN